jgi:TonB family protein
MGSRLICVTFVTALLAGRGLSIQLTAQIGTVKSPRKVKNVTPIYPPESLSAGDEGAVIIELKVDASGSVTDARVIWSKCAALNESALTAVRAWRYEQVRVNGEASAFAVTAEVPFRLPEKLKSRARRKGSCKWVDPPKATR